MARAEAPDAAFSEAAPPGLGHDFTRIGVHPPDATDDRAPARCTGAALQRKCACASGSAHSSGECEECSTSRLQRKPSGAGGIASVPPVVRDVLRSPGEALDTTTRGFMESRFGHDFGRVRVHTDSRAGESARAVSSLAYTVGQDVVFAAGRYAPRTHDGRELLAHELAHTIQQSSDGGAPPSQAPDGVAERSADSAARAVAGGQPVSGSLPAVGVGLSRNLAPPDAYDDEQVAQEIRHLTAELEKPDLADRTWTQNRLREFQAVADSRARAAAVKEALAVADSMDEDLKRKDDEPEFETSMTLGAEPVLKPVQKPKPPAPPDKFAPGGFTDEDIYADLNALHAQWEKEEQAKQAELQKQDDSRFDRFMILRRRLDEHGHSKSVLRTLLVEKFSMRDLQILRKYGLEWPHWYTKWQTFQNSVKDAIDSWAADQHQKQYGTAPVMKALTQQDVEAMNEKRSREEDQAAWVEGLPHATGSVTGGFGAWLTSKFTDDPKKITAGAMMGTGASGVMGSFAAAGGQQGLYTPKVERPYTATGQWRYSGSAPIRAIEKTQPPIATTVPPPSKTTTVTTPANVTEPAPAPQVTQTSTTPPPTAPTVEPITRVKERVKAVINGLPKDYDADTTKKLRALYIKASTVEQGFQQGKISKADANRAYHQIDAELDGHAAKDAKLKKLVQQASPAPAGATPPTRQDRPEGVVKMGNRVGRSYRIFGSDEALATSAQGYQVYEYRDKAGALLYVGKAGGEGGKDPGIWTDRLYATHIETEWIGRAVSVTVTSGLTFQEAFGLEEVLIPQAKHNIAKGEYSRRAPAGDPAANALSASKKGTVTRFRIDVMGK